MRQKMLRLHNVFRLGAALGWMFGSAALLGAIVVRLGVMPGFLDPGVTSGGMMDFSMACFLLSMSSRAILNVETEHGTLL